VQLFVSLEVIEVNLDSPISLLPSQKVDLVSTVAVSFK